jgi:hypothetical protein
MKETLTKIEEIISEWGIDPKRFTPTAALLTKLGEPGVPMHLRTFLKIIRGTKQATFAEAKRFAEWLETSVDCI